jgi:pimeloyl-ACP methyl ester carboxylesterase
MPIANINGININYKVQGQGEPLIMIIGAGSDQSGWRYQIGSFKKYFRTITFDNRGAGKSDKPTGPYTMRMMADDTVGLMDHLRIEKAHVLGGSMGGMIAQELAINHPERVDKLVLAGTFAKRDGVSGFSSEVDKAIEAYKASRDQASQRRLFGVFMSSVFNKWYYRVFIPPLMKIAIRFFSPKGVAEQFEAVLAHDAADRLGMIKASTLVITGTEDRAIRPVSSDVIASLVPNAKLVKVLGGGHNFPVEMKDEFNREVLDFLRHAESESS